jgi:N-acetylmuramic acid 6-phosphate etherase
MDASEIAGLMNQEDSVIPVAIRGCLHEISEVMGWAAESLRTGGRLVYAGAGTSGRLGVLDASECPPTFGVNPDRVIGVQAGGMEALFRSIEGAEDDADAGAAKMDELGISSRDTVVGIAASGGTRFTLGALARARELGAKTAALVSNPGSPMTRTAEVTICPVVGPEVLTGSTRLKSGTSHKMVLNMISTGAMALTGKVYENLMVDVVASNQKLRERAVRIVARGARVEEERAGAALSESGMEIKTALVMLIASVGPEDARRALSDGNSNVAAALLRFRRD